VYSDFDARYLGQQTTHTAGTKLNDASVKAYESFSVRSIPRVLLAKLDQSKIPVTIASWAFNKSLQAVKLPTVVAQDFLPDSSRICTRSQNAHTTALFISALPADEVALGKWQEHAVYSQIILGTAQEVRLNAR